MGRRIHLVIALCIVMTLFGCSTAEPVDEIAEHLDSLAATDLFSGVVLIAKDGEPILTNSYGYVNHDDGVSNRVDTKFNLGSMNKMFTAIAIMQLVQQGNLAVDDPIIEHLPDYPNQEVAGVVTIHHLLTHTSGLGDFFTEEFFNSSKERFRELGAYLPLFVDRPLRFEPGAQFHYSNAGFIVLGLIIEEISGRSYFDYVMENIYQPCGMTNTDSFESDEIVPNRAIGHSIDFVDDSRLKNNFIFMPIKDSSAGGGYSTVEDLLKFSNCLVNFQLLSPELTEILLEGKVENLELGVGVKYGYGFMDRMMDEHRIVGHGGGAPGICANLDIILDMDYTVVVLANLDNCRQTKIYVREKLLR
jgi:CubicO group peptidase (beta-lactamase class C family)